MLAISIRGEAATVLHHRVNGYDMAYLELGNGPPLVCIHGSLCDFRIWSCVLGPLSRRHRLITPSLRHFFPELWDGAGTDYTMAQHVSDTIGFIEALGNGPVHLMGHSRGGHIAFRVAQQRPDLLRRVVLAEPGGDLDASLAPPTSSAPPLRSMAVAAAEKIAQGDVDGGLAGFIDVLEGEGAWRALPEYDPPVVRINRKLLSSALAPGFARNARTARLQPIDPLASPRDSACKSPREYRSEQAHDHRIPDHRLARHPA